VPCSVGFLVTPKKLARGAVGGDALRNKFHLYVDGFSLFAFCATPPKAFYVSAGHEWHGSARSCFVNEVGVRGPLSLGWWIQEVLDIASHEKSGYLFLEV
jgi:hypothetical protein